MFKASAASPGNPLAAGKAAAGATVADGTAGIVSKLTGKYVQDNKRTPKPTVELEGPGKVVGLYFSSHFSAPCRAFFAEFCTWWQNVSEADKKVISVVLCGTDTERGTYQSYASTLPDGTDHVPWENGIAQKFNITEVPCLLFMDAMNGDVIDPNGRGLVKYDPLCTHMEWKPIDIREVLLERDFIIAPKKKQDNPLEYPYAHVGSECLKGKVIAIYFATTWLEHCKAFSAVLKKLYKTLLAAAKPFDIVYCAATDSQEVFLSDFHGVPWLALAHDDPRKNLLTHYFHITGVPRVILLDEHFSVITTFGRAAITDDPDGHSFPWKEKVVNELTLQFSHLINEVESLIWITDGTPDQCGEAREMLMSLHEHKLYQASKIPHDIRLLYTGEDFQMRAKVLKYFDQNEESVQYPLVVFMDFYGDKVYRLQEKKPTLPSLETFLKAVFTGEAPYVGAPRIYPWTT